MVWSPKVLIQVLVLSIAVYACQKTTFQGANGGIGNSVPVKPPMDLSKEYIKKNPQTNLDDIRGPKPGLGVDPKTGQVPITGPINTKHAFSLDCSSEAQAVTAFMRPIGEKVEAVLRGKICTDMKENLHLMFISDASASNGKHHHNEENVDKPGSDEVENGTCKKLQIGEAFVNKWIAKKADRNIVVSFIPFANNAIEKRVIQAVPIEDFKQNYLNADYFCGYVAQAGYEVPGESYDPGIVGDNRPIASATNYEAGFDRASSAQRSISASVQSTEVVFMTDGEPTVPGTPEQAERAAARAGADFRNDRAIKNMNMYAIYFGNKSTLTYQRAASILTNVVGSAERVIAAEKAPELADKLLRLPTATINLDSKRYGEMASVTVAPYGEEKIGIRYLKQIADKVWEYETQPFILLGRKSESVPNIVKVDIFGSDGFLFKSTLTINYTQQ